MVDHQLFDKDPLNKKKESHEAEFSPTSEIPTVENQVVGLQSSLGNQGVQRMLSGTNTAAPSTFIQAKMVVGAADDAYEREADQVAQQVVNAPVQRTEAPEEEQPINAKRIQREAAPGLEEEQPINAKRIQREAAPGLEEEQPINAKRIQREAAPGLEEEQPINAKRIQREAAPGLEEEQPINAKRIQRDAADMSSSFEVGEDIESSIQAKKGNGSPLPESTRTSMESSFGQDFSGVNIHTDTESDSLNQSVQARAFTTGSDIFFRQGEYNPESGSGKELLAHELTHVVQQGGSIAKKDAEE